jgi:nucleoside diphosphate kinase
MTTLPGPPSWPVQHLPRALLGYLIETHLLPGGPPAAPVRLASPWDAWWACYRAGTPLGRLGAQLRLPSACCPVCVSTSRDLASTDPPRHPAEQAGPSCGCLLKWAIRMRSPAPEGHWPPWSLTLALIKPDAPAARIRERLAGEYGILATSTRTLTTQDTRRMYPEAYGADYVAARDAYLTSGPVAVLVLRARSPGACGQTAQIKAGIRRDLGAGMLRNHLHMPDNPGEALADIAHFAGPSVLAELYERHERDQRAGRLAVYRAALGIGETGARRDAS